LAAGLARESALPPVRAGAQEDRTLIACDTTVELDMVTLIWTRGERMSLTLLQERLRCPRCGNRTVQVFFDSPNQAKASAAE